MVGTRLISSCAFVALCVHAAGAQCLKNYECVSQCGSRCFEECGIQLDAKIGEAQQCRRQYVVDGQYTNCSPESIECTFPKCDDSSSDGAHCFLSCERECSHEFLTQYPDTDVCFDRCSSNCEKLISHNGIADAEIGQSEEGGLESWSQKEVEECQKFCSISNSCLAKDEIYEFNTQSGNAEIVYMGSDSTLKNDNWQYASSSERSRLVLALEETESEESLKYQKYQAVVGSSDEEAPYSAADLLSALGIGGDEMGDITEAEMMQLIEQMMMGGMMYGEDPYGGYGGGYGGYGADMYGGGADYGSYEDDFDQ
jgi:hypothetical protein